MATQHQHALQDACMHKPERLYTWFAFDGTLCICCCDCGAVLTGAADQENEGD